MSEIVIVPTFDRPEYLAVCLEKLYSAFGSETKQFWICEDVHADRPKGFTTEMEMMAVIRDAVRILGPRFRYIGRSPHTTYGNSYNVLSALLEAASTDTPRVFLVEDDVMVLKDFFAWHTAAEDFHPWASCSGRINRSLNFHMNGPEAIDETIKDPEACVESTNAYISWATCFSRQALDRIRFMEPVNYAAFRPGVEQDMIIQDVIRREKLRTIWPYVPRAYHMGWYSYHLQGGMRFYGTLEEKINALRSVISDPGKIRAMAGMNAIDSYPKHPLSPFTALYVRKP